MDVFGEVRSILQQPPSMSSFFGLRSLFEDGTCPEEVFVYITEHLQNWPPHILRYPHHSWLSEDGGELPVTVAFCNAFCLTDPDVGFKVLRSWLSSDRWQRIDFLALPSAKLSPAQWGELGQIDALKSVFFLDVTSCRLGGNGLLAVSDLPFVADLKGMSLGNNHLAQEDLEVLANIPWTRLETLRLRTNNLDAFSLGPLARGKHWSSLQVLELTHNPIGAEGLSRLADSGALDNVTSLALSGCNITANGLERLVTSRGFAKLEVLDLSVCAIDDLSKSTHRLSRFQNLRALKLHANRLCADNLEHLLADDVVPRLEELDLSVTAQGEKSMYLLARCERFERLRVLDLAGNRLTADGARALAHAPWLANLEKLELGLVADQEFGVVEAFSNSPYLSEDLKRPWNRRYRKLCSEI